MQVITMAHCDRPDYTARSLAALRACHGVEQWTLFPRVEPGCVRTELLLRGVDWMACQVEVNPWKLGCNGATLSAFEFGFRSADFVVHVEDDVELAPDALEFFLWARDAYREAPEVFSATAYNRVEALVPAGERRRVWRRRYFHPWAWATWRDRWQAIPLGLVGFGEMTWDVDLLHHWVAPRGLREVYPVLPRARNFGERSALHPDAFPPEHYRHQHQTADWAGDSRGGGGIHGWREAA